jgi:hypothetical protein
MTVPGLSDGRGQIRYASVVEDPSQNSGGSSWLPHRFEVCPEGATLLIALGVALAIRLYLSLTSYCIAGDGVAYLGMARDFAAGEPARALDNVFSPLYPYLVSLAHSLVSDWELAGNLVSALLGTARARSSSVATWRSAPPRLPRSIRSLPPTQRRSGRRPVLSSS